MATKHDLFPDIVSGAVEETRNSSQGNLDDDEVKGSEGTQSRHVDGSVKAGSSACRLPREVDEGRDVSSSDKEKVTDRVRVGHRNGRLQARELVCVFETKSETGRTLEVRGTSVREFFVWSGSSRNNSVKTLEVDRPTECINPFSQRTTGVGEARDCFGKCLLLLSDFLKAKGKANVSESPIPQKRKTSVAKPLEMTVSNGRLDHSDGGYVQSPRYAGSCVHPDHVRNWTREGQELKGGRCDQSRIQASVSESSQFPAAKQLLSLIFSAQAVRKTRSFL